jgi:hypothetical protein|tara:strand:- start:2740 stop:2982 length:243 start_codon:yes stop_codon:yes gene_type:complete
MKSNPIPKGKRGYGRTYGYDLSEEDEVKVNFKPLPTRYAISPIHNADLWDRLMANRIKEHLEQYVKGGTENGNTNRRGHS